MIADPARTALLLACAVAAATLVVPAHPGAAAHAQAPIGVPAAAAPASDAAAPLKDATARVDALFAPWHRPDSPGAAVLVMRDGEVVHARGYGMANLEHGVPIRTTTVFDIASISKQFGAFALALQAADGALDLDDDVRTYIPELPDFGATITLRHLVHHTSGLRDWPGTLRLAGWDFQDVMSFQQILEMAFNQRELNFPPGSDYAYSNTGYNLMAEVVARVTGRSFRELTDERIFAPLGMRHTHFHDDGTEIVPGRAESYSPAGDGSFRRVVSSLTALGSSSLFTTIEDLALWLRSFHDPVVGADVMAGMTERGVLTSGDTISYAFGLMVGEHRGATTVSHGGSWAGYRSTLLRFPDHGLDVVILANASNLNAGALGLRIADIHLDPVLAPAPVPGTALPEPVAGPSFDPGPAELSVYEGEYRSHELHTGYRLAVDGDRLVARHFRTGTVTLQPVERDVFQAPWFGRVQFFRDDDDAIAGFTANSARIRGLRFDRVPGGAPGT
jgi:CubicO group peptidase (beta-lactamase class C family)